MKIKHGAHLLLSCRTEVSYTTFCKRFNGQKQRVLKPRPREEIFDHLNWVLPDGSYILLEVTAGKHVMWRFVTLVAAESNSAGADLRLVVGPSGCLTPGNGVHVACPSGTLSTATGTDVGTTTGTGSSTTTGTNTNAPPPAPTAPSVSSQPSPASLASGSTVVFSAAASGTPAPSVQWQISTDGGSTWSNVPGETATSYSFRVTQGDSGNAYRAVFTNSAGSATSAAAVLTVSTPPSVTSQPGGQSVVSGTTVTFSAAASGTPAPTVQWQVSTDGGNTWSNIGGATSTSYSFGAGTGNNGYQYRAIFTNSAGSAATNAAGLSVSSPTPPPPPPSPSISIAWSGAHPGWISMTLTNFGTGGYSYTCDFASGGDQSFSLTETSSPETFDNGKTCYDLEHGDTVWVTINGVSSNHIVVP